MTTLKRSAQLPKNYPPAPARYPLPLFRAQLEVARRYLFEEELKEALTTATVPLDALTGTGDPALNVAQIACFMQELRAVIGSEKGGRFGRDAFDKCAPLLPKSTLPPLPRAVSTSDKLFLRVREAMALLNKQTGSNFIVKWHGGVESDIFEDTGQHCYGYVGKELACITLTGYLQEAIAQLSGVKMTTVESECMATGALACRWHCQLA